MARGPRTQRLLVLAAAAAWAAAPAPAHAQAPDGCLAAEPPPITAPAAPLRLGVTPGPAGSAGTTQSDGAPVDQARTDAALLALRPEGRELVLRLNRLFWDEGRPAIERFAGQVDHYARLGFRSQIQLRFHPPEGREGDLAGWEAFVREAVRELGARRAVVAFDVTNEANFPISPNTSDGAYDGVVDAIARGLVAAREELDALRRPEVALGFNVAWRWLPDADARFWRDVGARATPAVRRALDYVGVQVYPWLVWPPVTLPRRSAGREVLEALTLLRTCYLPRAGLGPEVALWVTENGYATNLGRGEAVQAEAVASTVREVHRWSGTLGVTDLRYFNLRDNDSGGSDLFAAVGLLRDDYRPKRAFGVLRDLAAELGAAAPAPRLARRCASRGRLRVALEGDVTGVARVDFKAGRRLLRRDTAAPFAHVVGARVLARTRARELRAVVRGAQPAVLARPLPRCASTPPSGSRP